MVRRNTNGRKSSGTAGIAVIEDRVDAEHEVEDVVHTQHEEEVIVPKKERKGKAEAHADGNFGVGDIRKAATFVNSIGGLDKAIGLLQILKVAKEVQ